MEVDGTPAEVESQLIAMFRSMGTTDRDQLLSQLRAIIGTSVDEKTCLFFLDLGHWNLHEAIGAYYDHYLQQQPPLAGNFEGAVMNNESTKLDSSPQPSTISPLRLLSYHIISPSEKRELSTVLPRSEVQLRLFLENSSQERLPSGCRLLVRHSWPVEEVEQRISLPELIAGQVTEVITCVIAPPDSGRYEILFQPELSTGQSLGDELRVPLQVEGQALELEDQFMREVRTRPSEDNTHLGSQP